MITDIKSALRWGRFLLVEENNIDFGSLDAEVILADLLGRERNFLYCEPDYPLTPGQRSHFRDLITRRAQGEPVAYLLGQREFMGLSFYVDNRVLVPRPETELLVETALVLLGGPSPPEGSAVNLPPAPVTGTVVDVGTGSGAIGISLSHYSTQIKVCATDISPAALEVARHNAARLGVSDSVTFFPGNLLDPLDPLSIKGKVSIITANLPYIPSVEMSHLPSDVGEYEPHSALDGGPDGLYFYRQLIPRAGEYLAPEGYLLMEITPGQGQPLQALAPAGYSSRVVNDLAGRERLVIFRTPQGKNK